MSWVDKKCYWSWEEDRKKDKEGNFLSSRPPTPTVKKLDYVTLLIKVASS